MTSQHEKLLIARLRSSVSLTSNLTFKTYRSRDAPTVYLLKPTGHVMHQQFNLLKPTGHVMHQQFNLLKPTGHVMHQQFNLLKPTGHVMHQKFNLLNPTGYVMHQQFNIPQLYVLPTLYLCVLYLSENKQRLVPLTS